MIGLHALALSTWFTITAPLWLTQFTKQCCNLSCIVVRNTKQLFVYMEDVFTVVV